MRRVGPPGNLYCPGTPTKLFELSPLVRDASVEEVAAHDDRAAESPQIATPALCYSRTVRDHLSEVIDRVEYHHERVVVTRNGRDTAVLISLEDLAEMEETIDVLSDPDALADIREADQAYARGDVVRGVDAVRRLRG
ncbi:MAG: type II toxin-antitoxin system Phd/YefM family antitoxin [Acidimicrobiales bacterium]